MDGSPSLLDVSYINKLVVIFAEKLDLDSIRKRAEIIISENIVNECEEKK